jgi:Flp pilus assembly pilin Flp
MDAIGITVRNPLTAIRSNDRGTAAVEFALVAPAFIVLVVGTLYLCICLFLIGSLHYAVEEGARCASVKTTICTNATTIISYAQSRYFGPGGTPTFTYSAASCGNSVTASMNYVLSVGLTQFTVPISATACFP